ncbi:putative laccase 3 [Phaeomoniella chlamydospora]|uniref:laccase n=1 Tax=Phaeomoniella chlamydospora TaxID=158046 RepID=A0A0G2F020_PHACM|nr:putative laccase 3 [Phaeomoniella chlamydospora]
MSIATNYDAEWPVTGKTVKYSIDITNGTAAPDGFSRLVLGVNGKMPGPTLFANWGDYLEITVTNKLKDNGTSIHWHGIRQWKTSHMDGTNGVTECPLAPGQSRTYRFLCTQFGTTWFHSHYSAQYGDGVIGTIVINGPATSNYDVDLGTMTVQDWYYQTAYQLAFLTSLGGPPKTADNGLINGTMKSSHGGAYHNNTITKGKKYRLRLINTSVDNHFKVSLDNHTLTVITADFVPIKPYTTNWLFIGIGQRYDVIINANQAVGNYWFRAEVQTGCGTNANNGNIKSIFHYSGASSSLPTTNGTAYTQSCLDETKLVPYVSLNVPSTSLIPDSSVLDVSFATVATSGNQTAVQWNLNETAIQVDWEDPTLQYVLDGNTSYPKDLNLITLPKQNAVSVSLAIREIKEFPT